jgi:hypothetical protein
MATNKQSKSKGAGYKPKSNKHPKVMHSNPKPTGKVVHGMMPMPIPQFMFVSPPAPPAVPACPPAAPPTPGN